MVTSHVYYLGSLRVLIRDLAATSPLYLSPPVFSLACVMFILFHIAYNADYDMQQLCWREMGLSSATLSRPVQPCQFLLKFDTPSNLEFPICCQ